MHRIPAISSFTMLLTLTNEFSSLEITKPMDPLNVPDFQVQKNPTSAALQWRFMTLSARIGGPTKLEDCFVSPFMQRRNDLPNANQHLTTAKPRHGYVNYHLDEPTHLPLYHGFCSHGMYLPRRLVEVTS